MPGEVPPLWLKATEHVAQAIGSLKAAHVFGRCSIRKPLTDTSETILILDGVDRLHDISEELIQILSRMAVSIDNAQK